MFSFIKSNNEGVSQNPTEETALLGESNRPDTKHDGEGSFSRFEIIKRKYEDDPKDMTAPRRLVRSLSNYSWYYPIKNDVVMPSNNDDHEQQNEQADFFGWVPSLDMVWAYFEHNQLPRHHVDTAEGKEGKPSQSIEKAEAGESQHPTKLYDLWSTKEEDLSKFGIGVGLYFFTLRVMAILLFIVAIINLPNIKYYQSKAYNKSNYAIRPIFQSSAICTDQRWVACPSCTKDQFDYFPRSFDRYGEVKPISDKTDQLLTFIKRNDCRFGYVLGFYSLISLIVTALAVYIVSFYIIKRKEIEYDEKQQTTTDYAVSVENPPPDASDPDVWKDFFQSRFGTVSCVTVVLDNEELVRELVKRRQLLYQLEDRIPHDQPFNRFDLADAVNKATPLSTVEKLMCTSDAKSIKEKIDKSTEKIDELSNDTRQLNVSEVFVIFETESSQRECLKQMNNLRGYDKFFHNKKGLSEDLLFLNGSNGETTLLLVTEPDEPSAIRWQDLDESIQMKFNQRLGTYLITLGCLIGALFLITYARYVHGPYAAALIIMCLNSIAPSFCILLTDMESHSNETSKQASKYIKVTAFLWFNTTLATAFITSFPDTISNDDDSIIHSLYAIFFAELVRSPITQILDPAGFVYRHIMAPREKRISKLLKLFQATPYQISDRFTDMTNTLFLTFYYGTIFPVGYWFAAATMAVHYITDKYCILRVWGPGPMIGSQVSKFCRNFILITVFVYACMSSYNIAGFPFDNACVLDETVTEEYVGTFTGVDGNGEPISVTINDNDSTYKYCNQDMMRYRPPVFPAIPANQPEGDEWMDPDQVKITRVYGLTSVIAVLIAVVIICRRVILNSLFRFFCKLSYRPVGREGGTNFSDVKEIFAYVPQVKVKGIPWPFLLCDVSNIDPGLIGWSDPYVGHAPHNLILDIPGLIDKPAFSTVKDYTSPWVRARGLDKK